MSPSDLITLFYKEVRFSLLYPNLNSKESHHCNPLYTLENLESEEKTFNPIMGRMFQYRSESILLGTTLS